MFVATKHVFCRDKSMLVATNIFSSKHMLVVTKIFVTTNIILLELMFCRSKHTFVVTKDVFVAAKFILVAAPANNRRQGVWFTGKLDSEYCVVGVPGGTGKSRLMALRFSKSKV